MSEQKNSIYKGIQGLLDGHEQNVFVDLKHKYKDLKHEIIKLNYNDLYCYDLLELFLDHKNKKAKLFYSSGSTEVVEYKKNFMVNNNIEEHFEKHKWDGEAYIVSSIVEFDSLHKTICEHYFKGERYIAIDVVEDYKKTFGVGYDLTDLIDDNMDDDEDEDDEDEDDDDEDDWLGGKE